MMHVAQHIKPVSAKMFFVLNRSKTLERTCQFEYLHSFHHSLFNYLLCDLNKAPLEHSGSI